MDSINLLIVHSRPFIVEGIHGLVSRLANWHVVGEAGSATEALRALRRTPVDVVLVEQTLPGISGLALAGVLRDQYHTLSIGIIGQLTPIEVCIALAHGVGLFIDEHITRRDLHIVAHRLRQHRRDKVNYYHAPQLYTHVSETARMLRGAPVSQRATLLSQRETDVVALVCEGLTNQQIADRLGISAHTVKQHLGKVMHKCNVHERRTLAVYVQRMGWVKKADAAR